MEKYDWDNVWRECEKYALQCCNIQELADKLGIPRTTLSSRMKSTGRTFSSFVLADNEAKGITIEKLLLQNKALRQETERLKEQVGRNAWWVETVIQSASLLERTPVKVPPKDTSAKTHQVAIMMVSDVHMGQYTPAEEVGVFGEYNTGMAKARFNAAFDKALGIIKQQPFPVDEVVVWLGGDMVEHSHLRPGHEGTVDANVIKQSLTVADLLVVNLQMIASAFNVVRVEAVPGNHGRTDSDRRKCSPTDNFDYLIYHIAKQALKEQTNILWDIPEAWYVRFNVLGWNFFGMHGEDIKSYVKFPWYGATTAARNYVGMFRLAQRRKLRNDPPKTVEEFEKALIVPDYALLAHFHQQANWEAPDIEMFANGAMPGLSRYSAKDLKIIGVPKQNLLFVHPRYGVGLRCPILLDNVT